MTEKVKLKIPSVEELLQAGAHFGHQARRWHPKMDDFIFDKQKQTHLIDLYKTHEALETACRFLYGIASKGGKIIFVGTKKQAKDIVENEAKRCGAMYVVSRWVGGTMTNLVTIKKNLDKLSDLIKKRDAGELSHYTKKERLLIDREIERLNTSFGGIMGLVSKPDAIFVIDVRKEKTAVREARRLNIPIAALVDTNSDPAGINFVIPGNDDGIRSIALIMSAVSSAVFEGYSNFAKELSKEEESGENVKEKESKEETVKKVQEQKEEPKKKRGRPKKSEGKS